MINYNTERAYRDAVGIMVVEGRVSTSFIQRHLAIGFKEARILIERAEADGIISKPNHIGKREVLLKARNATH